MTISTVQFSNLSLRTRTAVVLVGALLIVYLLALAMPSGHWLLAVVALAFVLMAAWEFGQVTSVLQSGNLAKLRRFLYAGVVGLAPLLLFGLAIDSSGACPDSTQCLKLGAELGLSVFLAFLLVVLYAALEGRSGLEGTQSVFRDLAIGVLQIGWGGAALVGLVLLPRGEWVLLWLMLVVFSNDIAAYFVGSHFQGPKLAPVISPNKTISGAIGALVFGSLVGSVSHKLIGAEISALGIVLLTAGVIIAAQLGDLLKSLLKRLYGVKDTGQILPGHGGVLDRIDGLLFAAPLLYLVLSL